MKPLWVVRSFSQRLCDLLPLWALQLERQGYLVRVAEETEWGTSTVRALVILAVRPRWRWWLELVRRVGSSCLFTGHRWSLKQRSHRLDGSFRYFWRCRRCPAKYGITTRRSLDE